MPLSSDFPPGLARIGWRADTPLPAAAQAEWRLARVIAQHRNGYVLSDGDAEFAAQPAPRFLRRSADPQLRPAVGDFVLVDAAKPAIVHDVLPRRTTLSRAAAGERYTRQIIATGISIRAASSATCC
jgi:ribosome biogenesis GTPase